MTEGPTMLDKAQVHNKVTALTLKRFYKVALKLVEDAWKTVTA